MSVRLRLLVAVVTAGAVVAGGLVMERRLGASVPPPAPEGSERSGAWFCPHGGGEGWRAWITVANPSAEESEVRLTTWLGRASQTAAEIVPPGSHRTVEVPAGQIAAATVVEFLGSPAAAGMVVSRAEGEGGGVAAEPCAAQAAKRWYVPEASTLRGESAQIVLHNPFAVDAVVDVSLVAADRTIRPGKLRGIVLAPGQVRSVDLGRFALGEPALAAVVAAPLGRVATAGLTTSSGGVRAILGVAEPSPRWILPGGGDGSGSLVVAAPDDSPVPFHARVQTAELESALIDLEEIPGGTVEAFEEEVRDAGIVVEADGPAPLLAARRLAAAVPAPPEPPRNQNGGGRRQEDQEPAAPAPPDLASTTGAPSPAPGWVVLPPVAPEGGVAVILVENPGTDPAEIRVTPLGPEGPGQTETLVVAARTTVRVDLPQPAAAEIRATRGAVVAAAAALDARAYAVACGIPLD
jgi:Family of unknown function (DUF5719)